MSQRTRSEHTSALTNYLPGGVMFGSKTVSDSNLYKFMFGLAAEMGLTDEFIKLYRTDILPDETVNFIDEWESALGIPDDCFPGDGTLDERRAHVLVKLASLGVQTAQDFVDLGVIFGITITVTPAIDKKSFFPMTFPIVFSEPLVLPDERFTIIVEYSGVLGAPVFPLTFPIPFGTEQLAILECLFRKLIPANCDLIFKEA